MSYRILAAVVGGTAATFAAQAFAVPVDYDDASRPAYADGWTNGSDGSINPDGLGGWIINDTAQNFSVIASSASNGGGDIDASGVSFGLLDDGNFIDAFRFIDPADLQVGQTLGLDIDVNFRSGFKGIRVRGADDSTAIFRFEVGADDYVVYDAAEGNGSVGNAYSDNTQFRLELTQTAADGGTWSLIRSGGVDDIDSGTYSGVVSSFQLYSFASNSALDGNAEQAIYFNNFSITQVPEPVGLSALGVALATLTQRRR